MRHNVIQKIVVNEFIGLNVETPCYILTSGGQLTYTLDYFADKTVTNEGTASVTVFDNYVEFGVGSIYGIKIYQGINLINELPCVENNVDVNILHCLITGLIFNITGTLTLSTQNDYLEVQKYGYQEVKLINENLTFLVPFKTDKTKIYG